MEPLAGALDIPKKASHKTLWLLVAAAIVIVAVATYLMPDHPNVVAGFSMHQIIAIELILFLSGLMSGLSGFGFSAVGAAAGLKSAVSV